MARREQSAIAAQTGSVWRTLLGRSPWASRSWLVGRLSAYLPARSRAPLTPSPTMRPWRKRQRSDATIGAPKGPASRASWGCFGSVYAIRNNAGGTAAAVWKATTSGWVSVALFHEISFTNGTTAYAEGSTLSLGRRHRHGEAGGPRQWRLDGGSPAVRRPIITPPSGGAFAAAPLQVAAPARCLAHRRRSPSAHRQIDYDEANMVGNAPASTCATA